VGVLLVGTIGFYIVDRIDQAEGARDLLHCFYFTLVVLTTVGMEGPESDLERIYAILLMLVGIFLAAAAASNLVAFAIDGELNRHFGRRKMQKQINAMRNHFIVVGFGRMGQALCEQMLQRGEPFVLIELDEHKADFAEEIGCYCVRGDATTVGVLESAQVQRASGIAACLPHDPANVFVTLTARGINAQADIVARAEDPATEAKLLRAGANRVICPPVVGARRLHEMLSKPDVIDLIPESNAAADQMDICSVSVNALPGLIGKMLSEVDIEQQTGMHVAAVEREGKFVFNPATDFTLLADDRLIGIGPDGGVEQLHARFS
jgi:voltage-gated potassium channel